MEGYMSSADSRLTYVEVTFSFIVTGLMIEQCKLVLNKGTPDLSIASCMKG